MDGVMSESFTLQSMIRGPASLSQSSPPVPLVQLSLPYWQLRCWKQVPPLIADHRAMVILVMYQRAFQSDRDRFLVSTNIIIHT